jgi:CheY-like chemotaxis protein
MKKILVADQEEVICMLYAEELIEEGYDVVTVTNPKDFVQLFEAESPDLILLDMKMNDNDDGMLLRDIRSNIHDIPIILCTTHSPSKKTQKYLGVDDIVMKSSNFHELKVKIKRFLGGLESSRAAIPQPDVGIRKRAITEQMTFRYAGK